LALINDFICSINDHRAAHVTPGDTICSDESMVKWYGLGGAWSSLGLPRYVAKDSEPKNGCEIQNAARGRSGIMLRLHLVNTSTDRNAHLSADESRLLLGTTVLHRLVGPWARTGRIFCADSYFSSAEAALSLKAAGSRFIGVVKTALRSFPDGLYRRSRAWRARGLGLDGTHRCVGVARADGRAVGGPQQTLFCGHGWLCSCRRCVGAAAVAPG